MSGLDDCRSSYELRKNILHLHNPYFRLILFAIVINDLNLNKKSTISENKYEK